MRSMQSSSLEGKPATTIGSWIERFRKSEPRDPLMRRREVRHRGMEKDFWWKKKAVSQHSHRHSLLSDEEDDEEGDDSYVWMQEPSRKPASYRGQQTLDDLIAQDVEEFAGSGLSVDFSTGSRRRRKRGFLHAKDLDDDDEEDEDEDSVLMDAEPLPSPRFSRYTFEKQEKREDPLQELVHATKERSHALEEKYGSNSTSVRVKDDDVQVGQIVSELEAAMFSMKLRRDESENEEYLSMRREELVTEEPVLPASEPRETPPKNEQYAETAHRLREEIQEAAERARGNAKKIEESLGLENRPETTLEALASERARPFPAGFISAEGKLSHEENLRILNRQNDEGYFATDERTRIRDAYGIQTDMEHIAEDLDIAMLCMKRKLPGTEEPSTKSDHKDIEALKQEVADRLRVHSRVKGGVPPLPADLDASIDLLTARLRLANDFDRSPSRLQEYLEVDAAKLGPEYEALRNAFEARDWNEDGLITVTEARRIIEEFARWNGTPLALADEHLLKACGQIDLGRHCSNQLTFGNLVKCFDVFIPRKKCVAETQTEIRAIQTHVDEIEPSSSTSLRVGREEIEEIAERLRKIENERVHHEHETESKIRETEVTSVIEEPRVEDFDRGLPFDPPPPMNPVRAYAPTAPIEEVSSAFYLPEGKVLLDMVQMQSVIQSATIDFYKRRLEHDTAPVFIRRSRPMHEGKSVQASKDEVPEAKNWISDVDFEYDSRPPTGGRLRVRGAVQRPSVDEHHHARQQQNERHIASVQEQGQVDSFRADTNGSHFRLHEQRINDAMSRLTELQSLRKRNTDKLQIR